MQLLNCAIPPNSPMAVRSAVTLHISVLLTNHNSQHVEFELQQIIRRYVASLGTSCHSYSTRALDVGSVTQTSWNDTSAGLSSTDAIVVGDPDRVAYPLQLSEKIDTESDDPTTYEERLKFWEDFEASPSTPSTTNVLLCNNPDEDDLTYEERLALWGDFFEGDSSDEEGSESDDLTYAERLKFWEDFEASPSTPSTANVLLCNNPDEEDLTYEERLALWGNFFDGDSSDEEDSESDDPTTYAERLKFWEDFEASPNTPSTPNVWLCNNPDEDDLTYEERLKLWGDFFDGDSSDEEDSENDDLNTYADRLKFWEDWEAFPNTPGTANVRLCNYPDEDNFTYEERMKLWGCFLDGDSSDEGGSESDDLDYEEARSKYSEGYHADADACKENKSDGWVPSWQQDLCPSWTPHSVASPPPESSSCTALGEVRHSDHSDEDRFGFTSTNDDNDKYSGRTAPDYVEGFKRGMAILSELLEVYSKKCEDRLQQLRHLPFSIDTIL